MPGLDRSRDRIALSTNTGSAAGSRSRPCAAVGLRWDNDENASAYCAGDRCSGPGNTNCFPDDGPATRYSDGSNCQGHCGGGHHSSHIERLCDRYTRSVRSARRDADAGHCRRPQRDVSHAPVGLCLATNPLPD